MLSRLGPFSPEPVRKLSPATMFLSRFALSVLISLTVVTETANALGGDYIDVTPATVYEAKAKSPQNMDYDEVNNMFVAHSGWYNDKLVHYYKFRMYTPSTYKGLIAPGVTADAVPLQKIYIMTTTGDLAGAIGTPVIANHHVDGNLYSDFMEINLVTAPEGYVADTYKSEGDIQESGAAITATGVILNIPVVPTGSKLQDPAKSEASISLKATDDEAPIAPTPVFYKGQQVWTYVFEVTDQTAADYFSDTRSDPTNPDYAITVTPFASSSGVDAAPLWHVNQYSYGVTPEKANFGGPSDQGMRNIINLDRPDPGYSPLWAILWATELPLDYMADEASNAAIMTPANGFVYTETPMFVNCPDIGAVGLANPSQKQDSFQTIVDAGKQDSHMILGSHMTLIMQADVPVTFATASGVQIGSTVTNMMGAYEFELLSSAIPAGTTEIVVQAKGQVIRTVAVENANGETSGGAAAYHLVGSALVWALALLLA